MNVFCIGSGITETTAGILREELVATARLFTQLDMDTLWSTNLEGRVFAGCVHTPNSALGTRRYVATDDESITLYDGTVVDSLGNLAFQDAKILGRHWDELPDRLEGQFAVVRISRAEPCVELLVDFLGMRPVDHAEFEGGHLISNSADLLSRATGRSGHDGLGLSTFLTWGWAGADRTLVEGVRTVPPAQVWSLRPDRSEPTTRTYYPPRKLATIPRGPLTSERIQSFGASLRSLVSNLSSTTEQLRCGLTAGRDSRLLAAILCELDPAFDFVTYAAAESIEARIALKVANTLQLSHKVDEPPEGGIVSEWDTIAPALVRQNDGLVGLRQVGVMLNREETVHTLGVLLAGHGGEIARGFYQEPFLLLSRPSAASLSRFMGDRLVDRHAGLITEQAERLTRDYLRTFVDRMLDEGFEPGEVPDAFYTYERVGRWASTVGVRPSLPIEEVFEPLCTRVFVEAAFGTRPVDRYREMLHLRSVSELAPALATVPYENAPRPSRRVAKDVLRWIARKDPIHILERRKARSGLESSWLGDLLPRIREICLDQSNSDAWELIDRPLFERITKQSTSSDERTRYAPGLMQVATVFYHSAGLETTRERTG
jgi:asparagine synthase (glutamine-hydrolysing)